MLNLQRMTFVFSSILFISGSNARKEKGLNKMATCPESVSPPVKFNIPSLECWPLATNCYCSSPIVNHIETGKKKPASAVWTDAVSVCVSLEMSLVEIETAKENELIKDLILGQEALQKLYWTKGAFNPGTSDFAWLVLHGPNLTIDLVSKPLNYTNWAPGYPKEKYQNDSAIILNCGHETSCKWENRHYSNQAGVMCETPLDPGYKKSNVTRKARIKEFEKPSEASDRHQQQASAGKTRVNTPSMMKDCPHVAQLPPESNLPSLECWAFKENHHCYCFSPFVLVVGLDVRRPTEPMPSIIEIYWETALQVCLHFGMNLAAIETREENEMLSKHIIENQSVLSPNYSTSGFYGSNSGRKDFVWLSYSGDNMTMIDWHLFNYTNWAKGYPLANRSVNDVVLLHCGQNRSSCEWKHGPMNETFSGILCEAELDPSYKIPNVTRTQVELKKYVIPDYDEPSKNIPDPSDGMLSTRTTNRPITSQPKSNGNILNEPFIIILPLFAILNL